MAVTRYRYEGRREAFVCPVCRRQMSGPHDYCGGSFTDRHHPSAVRPLLVELHVDGALRAGEESRLIQAANTYHRP